MKFITKNEKRDLAFGILAIGIILAFCISFAGCTTADANPTSRATTATVGDVGHEIKVVFEEKSHGNTLNITLPITLGDLAFASADSKGSTETSSPTLTPTTDIKPDIDVNYAQGGSAGSSAGTSSGGVSGILETLTSQSLSTLGSYIKNKTTGSVTLTKNDGSTVTADCKDGSCYVEGIELNEENCKNCFTK